VSKIVYKLKPHGILILEEKYIDSQIPKGKEMLMCRVRQVKDLPGKIATTPAINNIAKGNAQTRTHQNLLLKTFASKKGRFRRSTNLTSFSSEQNLYCRGVTSRLGGEHTDDKVSQELGGTPVREMNMRSQKQENTSIAESPPWRV